MTVPALALQPDAGLLPDALVDQVIAPTAGGAARPVLQPGAVTLRHIKQGALSEEEVALPGEVEVLRHLWTPQDRAGVNGDGGFIGGEYEPRLSEEVASGLVFPNAPGTDGVPHGTRFGLYDNDTPYAPGDEWLEVYWGHDPDPIAVFTPTEGAMTRAQVPVSGKDGLWTQLLVRETAAGTWHHAPRDVIEHYLGTWLPRYALDMNTDPTADGGWGLTTNGQPGMGLTGQGTFRLRTLTGTAYLIPSTYFTQFSREGTQHGARNGCVRFEVQVVLSGDGYDVGGVSHWFAAELGTEFPGEFSSLEIYNDADDEFYVESRVFSTYDGALAITKRRSYAKHGPRFTLAIEIRGPWTYYYVDGDLHSVLPSHGSDNPSYGVTDYNLRPLCRMGIGDGERQADIEYLLVTEHRPHLLRNPTEWRDPAADRGDYHLPGLPPAGGLWGEYFDDAELRVLWTGGGLISAAYRLALFNPLQETRATREDAALDFTPADPPEWQAIATLGGDWWSARWTGAIYLDLEADDARLRFETSGTGNNADRVRAWVGKTMSGDQIVDTFNDDAPTVTTVESGSLRAHLARPDGKHVSGWYPIVVEYAHVAGGAGLRMLRELAAAAGVWTVVPSDDLSQAGTYNGETRFEPHGELVKSICGTFGYQFISEPKSLESGLFPCQVVPRVRVGRDTDYVLASDEATGITRGVNAEEVCEVLLADAAGLGRDDKSQLTAMRVDFERLGRAAFVRSDHESLSDITSAPLLEQRMDSLLALRGSPWEELQATPAGNRELRGDYPPEFYVPLETLEAFEWGPGDGVRLRLPELMIRDLTPRQIAGVPRQFVPGGLGEARAAFRQRPRNLREMLRRMQRLQAQRARHYQGQLSTIPGSYAEFGGTASVYSNVPAPANAKALVVADLVVQRKTGANPHKIQVNGVDAVVDVVSVGRYDITEAVAVALDITTDRGVRVSMVENGGPFGETLAYSAELKVVL